MSDGKVIYQVELDPEKAEQQLKALNEKLEDGATKGGIAWGNVAKAMGAAFAGVALAAGAAIAGIAKESIEAYGEFEQLEGGVKKLFGDDVAGEVMANANKAFSDAGMSANDYMETVTGFSASLISGLNGDTKTAAKIANQAIIDMSDNANTFGTDIESIKNAYAGFAKGNFTMLDNLKLGYGGTKEEMLRLVQDAGVVEREVSSLDEVTFDEIILSISKIQENLNIAGTTAKEASTTIQGSVNAMKGAWQNLLVGMADENANFSELVQNFIGTLITEDGQGGVIGTLIPRISQVIEGIGTALTTLIPALIQSIVPLIMQAIPVLAGALTQAIAAILEVLPEIIPVFIQLIMDIAQALLDNLPTIIKAGIEIIIALILGLIQAIPQLIEMLPQIITTIVTTIIENLPLIIEAAIQIMIALIFGLIQAIPQLLLALPEIIAAIINAFANVDWGQVGGNLIQGITSGIVNAAKNLVNAVVEAAKRAWNAVKNFLGIKSPSKLFNKTVGVQMIAGEVGGVEDETPELEKAIIESQEVAYKAAMDYSGIDPEQFNATMGATMSAAYRASVDQVIEVPLSIDGREVARATAYYTGEQLAWEAR